MSIQARTFKRQLRDFQKRIAWNNGPDRVFGRWKLIDNHLTELIPGNLWEFDFCCSNGKGVYILRLRFGEEVSLNIVKDAYPSSVIYLVAVCSFDAVTDNLLHEILNAFEAHGIPKWKTGRMQQDLKPALFSTD